MPQLSGIPICIRSRPTLSTKRGKLLSGSGDSGTPVYAASFIKKRRIVLETDLLGRPGKLRLIVVHEVFHFVWARLGNSVRQQFADLLVTEFARGARGELGESADVKKSLLERRSEWSWNSRLWREYVCESFCDTAAWLYAGVKRDPSFTLANRWRRQRERWFQLTIPDRCRC